MPDGNDLPRTPPGWAGGVAAYLRHLRTSNSSATMNQGIARDDPPHMRSAHSVGLMYDDTEVLGGDSFGLNSTPYDYTANPSTHSGLDTSNRMDPRTQVNRPDQYKNGKQAPTDHTSATPRSDPVPSSTTNQQPPHQQQSQQPPTQQVRFAPVPNAIPTQPPTNFPPPSNPINTKQGWKGSRPGNQRGGNKDVEMQDAESKKNNMNPQYHFTSKVQDFADPQTMISRIGDMRIDVPLFQLLGLSPQLSRLMSENTRTKRKYRIPKEVKSAELFPYTSDFEYDEEDYNKDSYSSVSGTKGPKPVEKNVYVPTDDSQLDDFVFRCASGVAQIPTNRFFAMTVGDVRVTINGTDYLALIDSGSKLNVGGEHLPESANLPMDFNGMHWSLKGINGDFEQLLGCAIDAPIHIGGHDFSHHIFISQQSIGRHDIILGQPFLQAFSARLDYNRGDHCKLYLWKHGERNGRPTLMISITDPNSPRNATAIRLGEDAKTTSTARIEEVHDQGFRV